MINLMRRVLLTGAIVSVFGNAVSATKVGPFEPELVAKAILEPKMLIALCEKKIPKNSSAYVLDSGANLMLSDYPERSNRNLLNSLFVVRPIKGAADRIIVYGGEPSGFKNNFQPPLGSRWIIIFSPMPEMPSVKFKDEKIQKAMPVWQLVDRKFGVERITDTNEDLVEDLVLLAKGRQVKPAQLKTVFGRDVAKHLKSPKIK